MFINNEAALRAHLKAEPMHCYYLYGKNDYLVRHYAARLAERASGGTDDAFSRRVFHLDEDGVDEVADAVSSVSFFGGAKCVTVRAFSAAQLQQSSDMNKLLDLVADVPDYSTLVVVGTEPPSKTGKRSLYSEFDRFGCIVELSSRERADILAFCQRAASRYGVTLKAQTCDYLMRTISDDMQTLSTELAKLCAYVGKGGEITNEIVDLLCPVKLEERVMFDITRALLRRDVSAAYSCLATIRSLQPNPIGVLGALAGAFVDLYRVKLADIAHIPAARVASDFGYRDASDFRLQRAYADAERLSLPYLRACIVLVTEADRDCKLIRTDKFERVEQLFARILAARQDAR